MAEVGVRHMNKNKLYAYHFEKLSITIIQEQLSLLLRFNVAYFWASLLAATLLCGLLWFSPVINRTVLALWYIGVLAVGVLRWLDAGHIKLEALSSRESLHLFARRYLIIGIILSGIWGCSSVLLYSADVYTLALHLVILLIMAVINSPVLVLSRWLAYLQIALLLLPLAFMLVVQTQIAVQLLGVGVLLLGAGVILSMHIVFLMLDAMQVSQLRMMEQMNTDPVTQLANRRYFEQMFKLEWRRAARDGHPIALLMIDVDQFKLFNDQHGHHAGDKCLQVIASCLRSVAQRASDIVARYGGEEFVVLLPNTSLNDALKVAEQLRCAVEKRQLAHAGNGGVVTVSIGVSCCIPSVIRDGLDGEIDSEGGVVFPAMLLRAADNALYQAKHNGRNQIAQEPCGGIHPQCCVFGEKLLATETDLIKVNSLEKRVVKIAV
ncbi:MAG: hypothetical protein CR991_07890 [Proteobacteria bacterium]|nr:MAG: hypothetical protein CR991_07890 [Pseudomonadota bacterium]